MVILVLAVSVLAISFIGVVVSTSSEVDANKRSNKFNEMKKACKDVTNEPRVKSKIAAPPTESPSVEPRNVTYVSTKDIKDIISRR